MSRANLAVFEGSNLRST